MKKLLLVVVALALVFMVSAPSFAQEKIIVSVGPDLLLPMGSFSDVQGIGFGGSARGQYNITPMFSAGLTIGYYTWSGKDFGGLTGTSFHGLPIRVFGKYYFMPEGKMRAYGIMELGFFFSSFTAPSVTVPGFGTVGGGSVSSTDFNYAPGVGVEFPVGSGKTKLDASVRYDGIASTGSAGSIGFRVGINFPVGG